MADATDGPDRDGAMTIRGAIALTLLIMVAGNVVANRLAPVWGVTVALVLVGTLALVAGAAGFDRDDLGLAPDRWSAGMLWGGLSAAVVAAACVVAWFIPPVRAMASDVDGGSWADVVLRAGVLLPLGTVLGEEFAFRGVLWALLRRARGPRFATLASSALFGLWHVLPALTGSTANVIATQTIGDGGGRFALVIGTVLLTGSVGVVFCALRVRSGSLLAPIMLHWALNGCGIVFVAVA